MENPLSETTPPHPETVIEERGKRIKLAAELGLARSSGGRLWARALRRRLHRQRKPPQQARIFRNSAPPLKKDAMSSVADVVAEVAEEKEEVEDRVKALQRLVPGGEEMEVERLFEETADYIEALREQVTVMRALACLLDGIE